MSRTALEALFGRGADYECRFGNLSIVFLRRGTPFDPRADRDKLPAVVYKKEEIPYVYGNGQFAFDKLDRLVAFTLIGETDKIITKTGTYSGSHLKYLEDRVLRDLGVRSP